jgi:iron complex outermembrane receptor protein
MLNWSHFSLTSSLFQNNVHNFIYINRLENWNFTDSILQGMPVFEFKEQDAILRGFELQYDYHPHPLDWLHIGQSLSYVTAHFVGATNTDQYYLPNIPPMRLVSNVQAEFPKFGHYLQDLELGVNYMYVWRQTQIYSAFQTETNTKGYGLLNAKVSAKMNIRWFESLDVVVSGNNLLNTVYQDHLSRLKYAPLNTANGYSGVWNMGRNISVQVMIGI